MSSSHWPQRFWTFLRFWTPIGPPDLPHPPDKNDSLAKEVSKLTKEQRETLLRSWERDLDQVNRDLESTRSSSSPLFLAVGLITGLVSLVGTVAAGVSMMDARPVSKFGIVVLLVGVAASLLFFAAGTAFLAYRTQQVVIWGSAQVNLVDPPKQNHDFLADYLKSLYAASRNNQERLRTSVGYLDEAQKYLRVTLLLLAVLVFLSLVLAGYEGLQTPSNTTAAQGSAAHRGPMTLRHPFRP